jgi:hypothetical protein
MAMKLTSVITSKGQKGSDISSLVAEKIAALYSASQEQSAQLQWLTKTGNHCIMSIH